MLVFNPDGYKLLLKPLLFNMPPETAQSAADFVLKQGFIWRKLAPIIRVRDHRLKVFFNGTWLENPVGLAAGYDKNCEFLPSLAALGFGYVIGGTVTESPRPGNPAPRILRYTRSESLVNSLGFPSKGLEHAAQRLERSRDSFGDTQVAVSVSGVTADEITRCHRRLEPLVDAVEVNISSPNTAGLRAFQEPVALADLLNKLNDGRQKPLFVKLPPYGLGDPTHVSRSEARERIAALAGACVESGVNAITVANTWPVSDSRLAVGSGGLSGSAVFPDMLNMVSDIKAEVGDKIAINACGGISTGENVWQALKAGATTVQLLTGLIYHGPGIVRKINRELLKIIEREGVSYLAA